MDTLKNQFSGLQQYFLYLSTYLFQKIGDLLSLVAVDRYNDFFKYSSQEYIFKKSLQSNRWFFRAISIDSSILTFIRLLLVFQCQVRVNGALKQPVISFIVQLQAHICHLAIEQELEIKC